MGAWGYGLLDNDDAHSVRFLWDKHVLRELKQIPERWNADAIIDFFRVNHFGGAVECGDSQSNSEVIAIAALLISSGFPLPAPFKNTVEEVITIELQEETLKEWKNLRTESVFCSRFWIQ